MAQPKPLMELCHDALAQGVLAKHGGKLPQSWIDLFKAHPAAWEQLTETVTAASYASEKDRPFGPESIVHVVMSYLGEDLFGDMEHQRPEFVMRAVRADDLPRWFYHLLEGWMRITAIDKEASDWRIVGASGGLHLQFNTPSCVELLYNLICDTAENEGGECESICHYVTLCLFEEFYMDRTYEFWDEVRNYNKARRDQGSIPIEFKLFNTSDYLRQFKHRARTRVAETLSTWIVDSEDLTQPELLKLLDEHKLPVPQLKEHVPSPTLTLFFTYNEETNQWWTGSRHE